MNTVVNKKPKEEEEEGLTLISELPKNVSNSFRKT